jgi:hypothetical protein
MIKFIKEDYASVEEAVMYLTHGKVNKPMIVFWYIIMTPIGLLLTTALKIWRTFQIYRWKCEMKKYDKGFGA